MTQGGLRVGASEEQPKSEKDKVTQMLERVMRVAELLAQRSQSSSRDAQNCDEKTQPPRSAVQ